VVRGVFFFVTDMSLFFFFMGGAFLPEKTEISFSSLEEV